MRAIRYLALAGLIAAGSAQAAPVTYTLDPGHTMVLFSWNHFGYSNPTANLGGVQGTLVYDAAAPTKSSVEVTLPLTSLDTHVPALDEHLKKPDFLDADKYPTVTFKSTKVAAAGKDKLNVTGDLTIHGVTKPVVLAVTVNKVGEHPMLKAPAAGFDATATIKRSDFGVGAYVPNVSDDIKIRITTEGLESAAYKAKMGGK
ncbi:polyisoprenoid-binding protein YceI [Luteibacter rhizovicinus]|uniref:Polyisoprenoid-binding protein YceI n=1 Tax=Luteibacter rhizovicinus TaxID=242606 RepID=A0A4R3YHQ1_9GAMM|nr:YceI family protein [Luteibacter rhizovicinus]TCV92145.1 polyisoprenoid-binding protein YceI [Luteibacter rhizovicinus]